MEEEICDDNLHASAGACVRKWLGLVGLVVDGQRWDLANNLFRRISAAVSQAGQMQDSTEHSSWEDVHFHWAVVAAKKMKDISLAALIIDELIIAHTQGVIRDSKRVSALFYMFYSTNMTHVYVQIFNFCHNIIEMQEQASDKPPSFVIQWLTRALKVSDEKSKVLFVTLFWSWKRDCSRWNLLLNLCPDESLINF